MTEAAQTANASPEASWRDYAAGADRGESTAENSISENMRAETFEHLRPPPKLRLADWIESNVYLPSDVSATPGRMRLFSYQRGICDAIDDPSISRCTFVKPVRIGATALIVAIAASFTKNDPCPILCLQPTDDDAKDFMVGTVDSTFAASPSLRTLITRDNRKADRQIRVRRFPGGSFKCVAAASPRNLRRHTVRVLLMDESSAYEMSPVEGSPIALAIKRTLSYPNRLIWESSTPTDETCNVLKSYAESDKRVFEIRDPNCGQWFEPKFDNLKWDKDSNGAHLPESAYLACPHCGGVIEETMKPALVDSGRWRATAPHVKGHAGFKCSALISTLANASWAEIVREYLAAKDDPALLRVWTNTLCGAAYIEREGEGLDQNELAARAEPFSLENLPAEIRVIVGGVDVQGWGLEVLTVGFSEKQIFVLDYDTLHGDPHGDEVWKDLESFTRQRFAHALGGSIGFDAIAVDGGDGNLSSKVWSFTRPRWGRRIFSTKGHDGNRPLIHKSKTAGLYVLGSDVGKQRTFDLLKAKDRVRFSRDLPARFYEEIVAERKVTKHKFGFAKVHWEKITGARNEALDCFVMCLGAREIVSRIDLVQRANELRNIGTAPTLKTVYRSRWMSGERE